MKKINDSLPKFDLVGIVKDSFNNASEGIQDIRKELLKKALKNKEGLLKEKQKEKDDLEKNYDSDAVKKAEKKLADALE